jgi:PAS domain S-box-containing protein
MKSGLFYRVLLSLLLLFVVSTGLMAFFLLNDAKNTVETFRMHQARVLTENLAEASLDALATKDYEVLESLLKASVLDDEFAYAYLSRANGLIIAHTNVDRVATMSPALGRIKTPLEHEHEYQGRRVRELVYPAYLGNKHMANAHLAYFLDSSPLYSQSITLRLIALTLIMLLLLSIATAMILRRVLAPIETLAGVMAQTTNEVPALSDDLLRRSDEVGLLARNFKNLMQRLTLSYNKLFEEKEFHQVTLDSIADAVIVTDEKGNVMYMNAVAEQLTGWFSYETSGQPLKSIFVIVDASTRLPIDNPVDKVLATGEVVYLSNHTTLIAKDKTEFQIADSASPIRDRKNNILGMVLVFNDVTEQYQLREASARSRKNLQAIMDNSPAVIYAKDSQGRYIFVNQKFEQLFQKCSDEVIGKTSADVFPAELMGKQGDVDDRILESGKTLEIEELIPVNDEKRSFLSVKFPLRDEDENTYAVCCISTDISERKSQEVLLRRSQKMEALGQLTGGVAHDYNNMLGIIMGYSELLEQMLSGQPKYARYVHEIHHAAERGSKLTRKLLSFTRHKMRNDITININTLILEQQQVLEKTLTARIKLTLDLDPDLWQVNVDGSDLEDAILNISINAMHAMASGGQLTIRTCNSRLVEADTQINSLTPGDYVLLTMTDTGCGMDEKVRERIFDPFFTTKGQRGTGLGLSQVYGFVQRSDGLVQVYSEPDYGTRFAFYFPRSQQISSEKERQLEAPEVNLSGSETVLVVDDEPAITSLTEVVLLEHGYQVFIAHDGLQALNILKQEGENIDIIISDIIMPDLDGCQLAREVQRLYPHIKIQMVSGFADDRHHGSVDDELHKNMMYKPCSSQALLTRIRHLLDKDAVKDELTSKTILIMDDDYDILELFQLHLEKLGYNTVTARSGEEALELYKLSLQTGDRIAAMIVDLTVPGGMGGKELAPKILALDENAKIIVASGYSGSSEMVNYEDYGFSAAMEKIFNVDNIKQILEQVLSS